MDGKIKKKKASKKLEKQLKALEDSGATFEDVPYEPGRYGYHSGGRKTAPVLVLRKFDKAIGLSDMFPFAVSDYQNSGELRVNDEALNAVEEGFRKGNILARKLMIRNQDQTTRFNRRDSGRIDRKRLHALGTQDDSVFYRLKTSIYEPVHLHLSVDASSSMRGDKFRRALMVGVALAVAADKIQNLDVVLSLRAGANAFATIGIVYDSRIDKPVKIRKLFPALRTCGTTPEGLCFAAILEDVTAQKASEMFFVNLSDGEPYYEDYGGDEAYEHTRKQINIMRAAGVKILSYFIDWGSDYGYGYNRVNSEGRHSGFDRMYGADASYINTEEIPGLIRTLNKLFLVK